MGRCTVNIDRIQIEIWKLFDPRNIGSIKKNCINAIIHVELAKDKYYCNGYMIHLFKK